MVEATASQPKDGSEPPRWLIGEGRTPFQRLATVLANRHKLAIIWELARGRKRFKELERALSPVTPKVLTRNLRDLEAMSLIVRTPEPSRAARVDYELSEVGVALRPHIISLCHWAYDHRAAFTTREGGRT